MVGRQLLAMDRWLLRAGLVVSAGIFTCKGAAQAQPVKQANPEAVTLFQEARLLMANGKFRSACSTLEATLKDRVGNGHALQSCRVL